MYLIDTEVFHDIRSKEEVVGEALVTALGDGGFPAIILFDNAATERT